jgi:hypothetical protein
MNAEQAWDHFVRQVMNVAGGIEEPTRAIAAGKLYAAHAVAEARAPLVAALEAVEWIRGVGQGEWCYVCMRRRDKGHAADCPLAAALAEETPDA